MIKNLQESIIIILTVNIFFNLYSAEIVGKFPCEIIDKRTRLPITNSNICIDELSICLITNKDGQVVFNNISPNIYTILITHIEYDTLILSNLLINSGINNLLTIQLDKKTNNSLDELDKIVVKSNKLTQKSPSQTTSVIRLNNYELSNVAGTANDINRVLETHPAAISSGSDFDNSLFVRGGHSRENVYIVDGIEINNINHYSDVSKSGGAFSYINGTLVDHLDFYAGGIPALYPPKISSVIDITMRNGSLLGRKYQFDFNISGLGLILEGPLFKQNVSYLIGMRFVDLHLLKNVLSQSTIPRFGDLLSKFSFYLGENKKLDITTLIGGDTYTTYNKYNTYIPTDLTENIYQFALGADRIFDFWNQYRI
jgi:hypothetical protein